MIRKIDVGSVFGNAQRTSYEYMKLLNEKHNGNFKTLVIDDKDGLHSLPFANHDYNGTTGQDVFYKLQKKIKLSEKEKQNIIDNAISLIEIKYNKKII